MSTHPDHHDRAARRCPARCDAGVGQHTHVRAVGNDGRCVLLSEGGREAAVQLPGYEHLPENRQHPLHVKVHLGAAGMRQGEPVVWVMGTPADAANCASYVNR